VPEEEGFSPFRTGATGKLKAEGKAEYHINGIGGSEGLRG
jgi:hypothetical protein